MSCTSIARGRARNAATSCSLPASAGGVAVVEQDQVDVARVVELAGAELAHAEHGEGGGLGIAADGELAVAGELQQDRIGERIQAARGEGAERAGHLLERPDPGDVGDGDSERHAALELAQAVATAAGGAPSRAVARTAASSAARSARTASGPRRHRSVIKVGFCRAVSVRYGLLPNRASSSATCSGIVGPRRLLAPSRPRHVPPLRVVRSRQAGGRKPRHAMRGSGKLLQSGGTLAQARRHRQEAGSIGLWSRRTYRVCVRVVVGVVFALAVLVVVAALRLMAGPVDLDFLKDRIARGGRRAGQRHQARADRISLEWGGSASRCGWSSPGCASPTARIR